MAVAANDVLVENDRVRVVAWSFAPGESTGSHHHEHDYVVVALHDAHFRVDAADGSVGRIELKAGAAYYREAGAEHDITSIGAGRVQFVEIELL